MHRTAAQGMALTTDDAMRALQEKLRNARAVQDDFDRRGLPLTWPVALTIAEAEAIAGAADTTDVRRVA